MQLDTTSKANTAGNHSHKTVIESDGKTQLQRQTPLTFLLPFPMEKLHFRLIALVR